MSAIGTQAHWRLPKRRIAGAIEGAQDPSDALPTIDTAVTWGDIAPGHVLLLIHAAEDGSAVQEVNGAHDVLVYALCKTPLLCVQKSLCPGACWELCEIARLDGRVQVGVDGGEDIVHGDDTTVVRMRGWENVDGGEIWMEERVNDAQVGRCGRSGGSACLVGAQAS